MQIISYNEKHCLLYCEILILMQNISCYNEERCLLRCEALGFAMRIIIFYNEKYWSLQFETSFVPM